MEEIEELRAKAIASMSSSANPNTNSKKRPIHLREEGELSSSGSDEVAVRSSSTTPSPAPPTELTVSTSNKSTQNLVKDKCVPVNGPVYSGDMQFKTPVTQKSNKHLEVDVVSSQSANKRNLRWCAPQLPKDNLVISFSDNESESDDEDYNTERTSDKKVTISDIQGNRRPPASSHVKSELLPQAATNQPKVIPNKVPLSRTFISSMTKINGTSARVPGSLVRRVSQIRNTDPLNKTTPSRDRYSQGSSLNNSELETLRQQIALRENQLKLQLKSVQEIQKTNTGSFHKSNGTKLKTLPTAQRLMASIESSDDEPAKKRLKLEHTNHVGVNSDGKQPLCRPARDSASKLKAIKMENGGGHVENQFTEGVPVGTKEPLAGKVQAQIDKHDSCLPTYPLTLKDCEPSVSLVETIGPAVPILKLPNNQSACSIPVTGVTGIPANYTYSDKGAMLVDDTSLMVKQHTQVAQMTSKVDGGAPSQLNMSSPNESSSRVNARLQHNPSADNIIDWQTLMEMEELQEKELEEAQEHRRRCEIEEKNALKAYRNAQKALVEANSRCTSLFRRRDLMSARFQSFVTEDSSSLWSSRTHKHQFLPWHQNQEQSEVPKQGATDTIKCMDSTTCPPSYQLSRGTSLVSQQRKGPGADENDTFDHTIVKSWLLCEHGKTFEEGEICTNCESERKSCANSVQDYALLEASLRSKLFSRMGSKSVSMNVEPCLNTGVECLVKNMKSQRGVDEHPLVAADGKLTPAVEGIVGQERGIHELSVQVDNHCHGNVGSSNHQSHKVVDHEDCSALAEICRSTAIVSFLPSPALKTVVNYVKSLSPVYSVGLGTRVQKKRVPEISHDNCGLSSYKFIGSSISSRTCLTEDSLRHIDMHETFSNEHNHSIDPFWPICMFELRGICHDEKCRWQHVKDLKKNTQQQDDPKHAVETSSNLGEVTCERKVSQFHHCNDTPAPPAYIVRSGTLGADLCTSRSVFARNIGHDGLNIFGDYLSVNFPAWNILFQDAALLHINDGRVEGQSWNRQSLNLKGQGDPKKIHNQGLTDPEQTLDLAIILFSQEVNKLQGRKKALSVLSRALESDRTSVVLWIVYLRIYYSTGNALGEDDMFLHAIQNNEGSYELWLMYINSRVLVDDHLVAYDTALSALCRHASTSVRDKIHASACILDLFLQMMDFLCMSEKVETAMKRICGLLPTSKGVSDNSNISLSNILSCLTVSDKGTFWVCCVYLVIYRKLPDPVIQQFECGKEFPFSMEWPSVQLTVDEKRRASQLMEMGVDSVALDINSGSNEKETANKSAHLLAVSHVQCVGVLEGVECSKTLLNKYIKLHPTCLELVLILARFESKYSSDLGYEGFENALNIWPKEVPGIQCIWNQYAQYSLENGEIKFTERLMVRWFQSFCSPPSPQTGNLNAYFSSSNSKDELFGLVNMFLYKLLQKDHVAARIMIDKALKLSPSEDSKHCIKEHALFVLSNVPDHTKDSTASEVLSLLSKYLSDSRFSPVSKPLSRNFCQSIKNPRTQQLINNVLGPVSCDCSLLNTVLEAWYGPSLLPENFNELKDLVGHVEAIMAIFPANYHFALSAFRSITKYCNSSGVTSGSVVFWASSLLVSSIYQTRPLAPERTWVEACVLLSDVGEVHGIPKRFHEQALSVYPFSVKLWKSYFNLSKMMGNVDVVIDAARKRGIKLE